MTEHTAQAQDGALGKPRAAESASAATDEVAAFKAWAAGMSGQSLEFDVWRSKAFSAGAAYARVSVAAPPVAAPAASIDTQQEQWDAIAKANTEIIGERDAARAQLVEVKASLARLARALKDITNDVTERFDMDSPSTNPGIKVCVEQAREALSLLPAKAEAPDLESIRDACKATPAPAMGEELPNADEFFKEQLSESGMKKYTAGEAISLKAGAWCEIMADYGRACMALRQPGAQALVELSSLIDNLIRAWATVNANDWDAQQQRINARAALEQLLGATAPVSQPAAQEPVFYVRQFDLDNPPKPNRSAIASRAVDAEWCVPLYTAPQPITAPAQAKPYVVLAEILAETAEGAAEFKRTLDAKLDAALAPVVPKKDPV